MTQREKSTPRANVKNRGHCLFPFSVLLVAATLSGSSPANASFIAVTSRGDLGGNDFVDWGQLGPVTFSPISLPASVISNNGFTEVLTKSAGYIYADLPGGGNWAPSDKLVYNGSQFDASSVVPLKITFASPVEGAGAQMGWNGYVAFQGELKAFDANNQLLFDQVFNGNTTPGADNSAIFLGVLSSTSNIGSIEFSATSTGLQNNDFLINQLDIKEASTPEPSTLVMSSIMLGTFGVVWSYKRLKRFVAAA